MINIKDDETTITENGSQKTAKQLQKEAKKLAKLEKFRQKQEKKETEKLINVKEKLEVSVKHVKYSEFNKVENSIESTLE